VALDIDGIARQILDAQNAGRSIAPISSREPDFTLDAGYAVAERLCALRKAQGAVVAGRKIGFTNANMWAAFGVEAPIWGAMYADSVVQASQGRVELSLDAFCEPRLEPEIVFHFHRTPPADADADALLDCIDWMAHGVEVVQSHFPEWKFTAADAVASGSLHAALLLAAPLSLEGRRAGLEQALEAVSVDLLRDDTLVESGSARLVLGNPLHAVRHLIQVLQAQGAPAIAPGELITTGTMTMAYPIAPGQRWRTRIAGLDLEGLEMVFTGEGASGEDA